MMAVFQNFAQALDYLRRSHQNRRLWTIIIFLRQGQLVSEIYVFASSPYVGNVMHGIAKTVLEYQGHVFTPGVTPVVTRQLSDTLRDSYFARGLEERGGHAEEQLVRNFFRIYPQVIAQRPDRAVIINSDSPCTLADDGRSQPCVGPRPQNPGVPFNFGPSCTTKLNQLAAIVAEIPQWTVYYRKAFGQFAVRGAARLFGVHDAAEAQMLSAYNLTIRKFPDWLEEMFRAANVP